MQSWLQKIQRLDWWLLGTIIGLQLLSNLIMYGINQASFAKQIAYAVISLVIIIGISWIDYRALYQYAYIIFAVGGAILLMVLLFGTTIRGTTGWFVIGPATFQPVELAKITLLAALARFFADHQFQFDRWTTIARAGVLVAIYGVLVIFQPDFGSGAIFTMAFGGLLVLTNMRLRQYLLIVIAVIALITVAWFAYFDDYQKNRILTFIDPSRDALDSGYNVTQSIISVGSGGLSGRGLGLGTQSQLRFLPERETDFIFAVISEELGLIGSVIVVLGIGLIIWRIWLQGSRSKQVSMAYFASGLAILVFIQSLVNIGMNIGLMPVTGVPLPFVSAGGSSLLSLSIAIGLIQSSASQQS